MRMLRLRIAVVLGVLLISIVSYALPVQSQAATPAADSSINLKDFDQYVADLMKLYDVPGTAVALVQDGKVIYAKGYGVRNTQTKQPVDANTQFEIGSITKSFTTLGIMQLVEAGKLDLDSPVTKYVPDVKFSDPQATQTITLRQLMSMSSGLPRYDAKWATKQITRRADLIKDLANIPLTAAPGKVWQYSNEGMTLVGYVAEQVSGQSWETYTRQHVLVPVGMDKANFTVEDMKATGNYADPHGQDILAGPVPIDFFGDLSIVAPAGAINASAAEMGKYLLAQLGYNSPQLISQKSLETMHTAQIKIATGTSQDAKLLPLLTLATDQGYGFGWINEQYRGHTLVQHDGEINGFVASATVVPADRVGVVVLANAGGTNLYVEAVRLRAVELLLGLEPTPDVSAKLNQQLATAGIPALVLLDPTKRKAEWDQARNYQSDPAQLKQFVGDYGSDYGTVKVSLENNRLVVDLPGTANTRAVLLQIAPTQFLLNSPLVAGVHISFKVAGDGSIQLLQDTTLVGTKPGPNATAAATEAAQVYTDPQGRFKFPVPSGLTVKPQGDHLTLEGSKAVFIVAAVAITGDDVKAAVKQWLQAQQPGFDLEPINVRPIPLPKTSWTQYLYQFPDQRLLAVLAAKQGSTLYLMSVEGDSAAIQAVTPQLNAVLTQFEIVK